MGYFTHEDWIHKMTTDELVRLLTGLVDCCECPAKQGNGCTAEVTDNECCEMWRRWLAEPAIANEQ